MMLWRWPWSLLRLLATLIGGLPGHKRLPLTTSRLSIPRPDRKSQSDIKTITVDRLGLAPFSMRNILKQKGSSILKKYGQACVQDWKTSHSKSESTVWAHLRRAALCLSHGILREVFRSRRIYSQVLRKRAQAKWCKIRVLQYSTSLPTELRSPLKLWCLCASRKWFLLRLQ